MTINRNTSGKLLQETSNHPYFLRVTQELYPSLPVCSSLPPIITEKFNAFGLSIHLKNKAPKKEIQGTCKKGL